jgi:hypothetical protein
MRLLLVTALSIEYTRADSSPSNRNIYIFNQNTQFRVYLFLLSFDFPYHIIPFQLFAFAIALSTGVPFSFSFVSFLGNFTYLSTLEHLPRLLYSISTKIFGAIKFNGIVWHICERVNLTRSIFEREDTPLYTTAITLRLLM